jgi:tripartite-type tricarboxylate transporter receptor subunit TctC
MVFARAFSVVLTAVLTAVTQHGASAQSAYPTRPVTIVVPAAAGGPTDTVARLIAESMSRSLGQTVLIENIGGAGGTIGMARVAKAAPDGYTLSVWHIAQATAPALYDGLKYDVVNDFDHIGRITDVPMTLVSKTAAPPKDVKELLDWIRAEKDKIIYGHAGVGSASHLCALIFMKELGVQMQGVAYRGTGPAMNDLISGQFDFMCDQTTHDQPNQGRQDQLRQTTKFSVFRLRHLGQHQMPGFRGVRVARHVGPKGLAQTGFRQIPCPRCRRRLRQKVERFASLGTEPVAPALATPDALKSHLSAEVKRWDAVIKAAGVKGN